MSKRRCIQITIAITMFVVRLFAYFPYYYDKKISRFQTKWFLLVYPIVFICSLCACLSSAFNSFLDSIIRANLFTFTANTVIGIFSLNNLCLFLFNYLSQYFKFAAILHIAKEVKQVMQFTQITIDLVDIKSLKKYWIKCIIIPIFTIYINNFRMISISKPVTSYYFEFIMVDIAFFVAEIPSILHYALLLCTTLTYSAINTKLGAIMDDANRLNMPANRNESSNRMQKFCDLSDRLDRVAEMHYRCSLVAGRVQHICTGFVTNWILNKNVGLITHLFLMFVFASKWQSAESPREYPVDLICYGGLLCGVFVVELFMLVNECTRAANEVIIWNI